MIVTLADQLEKLVATSIERQEDEASMTFAVTSSVNGRVTTITLYHKWIYYVGELKGYLVDGSYNFVADSFNGSLTFPTIDTHNSDLGSDWRKVEGGKPAETNHILITLQPDYVDLWQSIASSN